MQLVTGQRIRIAMDGKGHYDRLLDGKEAVVISVNENLVFPVYVRLDSPVQGDNSTVLDFSEVEVIE